MSALVNSEKENKRNPSFSERTNRPSNHVTFERISLFKSLKCNTAQRQWETSGIPISLKIQQDSTIGTREVTGIRDSCYLMRARERYGGQKIKDSNAMTSQLARLCTNCFCIYSRDGEWDRCHRIFFPSCQRMFYIRAQIHAAFFSLRSKNIRNLMANVARKRNRALSFSKLVSSVRGDTRCAISFVLSTWSMQTINVCD